MIKQTIRFTLLIVCSCLALSACDNSDSNPQAKSETKTKADRQFQSLKMFPQGKSFSGFQLTSHLGETWDSNSFKGSYSVLFFGFSNCPDICPTTLLDMQKIDHQLKAQKLASPKFIFVSVDPDRDTPEVLNEYINFFDPEFYALTGDAPNILSLASQLGVAYKVSEHKPGDLIYDVDHASALFILNPEGERIGLFTAPHNIEQITQDLATLMASI